MYRPSSKLSSSVTIFKRFNTTTTPPPPPPPPPPLRKPIDEYFTYFNTKATLRPLIYRPKNANTLLTMDLKDPMTKEPIKPRSPIKPIQKTVLTEYIKTIPYGSNEFYDWFKKWTSVTPRKREIWHFFNSAHFQTMIFQSFFKIGDFSRLTGYLYSKRAKFMKSKHYKLYDMEHFFNSIIACNLHRSKFFEFDNPKTSLKKLKNVWANVTFRNNTNGLSNLLVECLGRRLGFDPSGQLKGFENVKVKLPTISELSEQNDESIKKFHEDNENTYIITRTIAQFSDASDINPEVQKFNEEYQTLNKKFLKQDIYDEYMHTMEDTWSKKLKLNSVLNEQEEDEIKENSSELKEDGSEEQQKSN
ncbi:hypothetical protein KAFR_0K01460 [Kazachstania africana CBS 2517]|uniref:37S ribosomal protein MRP13, mitochondrial n=1 Tax=Kazachstania africana (strain ATCC 22294 / BCRC 22015 / CBS 2517 / CECT 1963 / NBRC 1671 / NRRL Y-8276) TaxID=1071382 RepID=H2B1K0_KAZAF|nr:hypothetical protein KAFR_0K01460 [Kazachstania africana CBS 2517]CCF60500.1 hypothetical protein KAFR_0K01460 [Kazachstania africana CBS 2517]